MENIHKSRLFNELTISEIENILSKFHSIDKHYEKDQIIVHQDQVCDSLRLLHQGEVQAGMINPKGNYTIVEELKAPALLAPGFLYASNNRYPVSVQASTNCDIVTISRNNFTLLLQENVRVLFNFLAIVSEQTMFLGNRVKLYGLSLKGKIARFLISDVNLGNDNIELIHTQQKLADMLGVARPSLARAFSELSDEGLISINKKKITILDKEKLRNLAE